jgi:iron complex transport system ATP-binding protein
MLLDEPTASLDFHNQAVVLRALRELSGSRCMTVVFTSHDPAHAQAIAHRALLLESAIASKEGDIAEVLTESNLSRLYGVPIRHAAFAGADDSVARVLVADLGG